MNEMQSSNDKRKYIRLRAYHLVKYKPFSETSMKGGFIDASIKDIGAGGVCLRTKEYLAISSILELVINFPAVDTHVSALAKVVWAKEITRNARYEIGAQFIQIDDSVRMLMNEQVRRVSKKIESR